MRLGVLTALPIVFALTSCANELGMREYLAVRPVPKTTTWATTWTSTSPIVFTPPSAPTLPFTSLAGSIATVAPSLNFPRAVTTDGTNVYIGETNTSVITKIVIATGQASTLGGAPAEFKGPNGLATDGTNIYVVCLGTSSRIYQINISTGVLSVLAPSFPFVTLSGVATDGTYVYVAEQGDATVTPVIGFDVRRVKIADGSVSLLAGTPGKPGNITGASGTMFGTLTGIATDGNYVYVDDFDNGLIRRIRTSDGFVDDLAATAGLNHPDGVATDGTNLYISDTGNNRIVQMTLPSGTPTTLVDQPTGGFTGPYELAVSTAAPYWLFVADSYSSAVKLIQ